MKQGKKNIDTSEYLALGISLGMLFGVVFDNIGLGMCLGVAASLLPSAFQKIRMMWMNDRHFVYWKLNAKEKFQRTMYMIPFVVILCFLTPFFMREKWVISDITLIVLLVWQLIDTYIKMRKEK